jgi:Protein of unknown function (DUF3800)
MYLYLDESGDLGFDFGNKKPSRFFVITLLALTEAKAIRIVDKAVTRTLDKKLNHKSKNRRLISELKGSSTTLPIKKYFLSHIDRGLLDVSLYAIVLDKLALLAKIQNPIKERVYNHMTHQILERVPFPAVGHVNLVVDRSKNDLGIREFNDYLYANLSLCLNLETKLYISHDSSEKHKCIQAADLFCYGIARKYELKDESWYSLFKDKIRVECEFKA